VITYPLKKKQILFIFFIYLFIPFKPIIAFENKDYLMLEMLLKSCYKDTRTCHSALFKIHNYQINSVRNKNFSCQTRLLGLEANLIMAMNSNLKIKKANSIINDMRKYC